jgi:hypothetical protein
MNVAAHLLIADLCRRYNDAGLDAMKIVIEAGLP